MKQESTKYQYSQVDIYKEKLELTHLKRKTLIVNSIVFLLAGAVLYYLLLLKVESNVLFPTLTMFAVLLIINLVFYSYDEDHFNSLKIAMYINTLGVYVIATTLIFQFNTPSIFTSLFLAYAITAIYQDYKSMILSNFALFFVGTLLVFRFPEIFELIVDDEPKTFLIFVFLFVFVALLTLSSYILIKRKTFFYNQLAQIKEAEYRNIELLKEIAEIKIEDSLNTKDYYDSLKIFSKELSKKIGISNIFNRKIELLKDLKTISLADITANYPEYNIKEINELKNMELEIQNRMSLIGIKASQSSGIEVSRKEIFSETQFKSFNHFGDAKYVKIISFVVFYCLLKLDKPYFSALDEEKVKDVLLNSEYFHRIEKDIINIYLENNEVFDTIVKDHMMGK